MPLYLGTSHKQMQKQKFRSYLLFNYTIYKKWRALAERERDSTPKLNYVQLVRKIYSSLFFFVINQMKGICGTSENNTTNEERRSNHQNIKPFANKSKPLENSHISTKTNTKQCIELPSNVKYSLRTCQ
jgi:hypothetical protein